MRVAFKMLLEIDSLYIKAVPDVFVGNPLNVYRAARYAACYEFKVAPETVRLMGLLKKDLWDIPVEDLFVELQEALKGKRPSLFFRVLAEAGVLDVHFEEIHRLIGVPQPPQHHPEGDAFEHSMQVLDAMANMTSEEELRWAALVHDLGKAVTPAEILPRHFGHEKAGVPLVEALGERLRLPQHWTEIAKIGAEEHMRAARIQEMRPAKRERFLKKIKNSVIGLDGMAMLVAADHRGRNNPDAEVPVAIALLEMGTGTN